MAAQLAYLFVGNKEYLGVPPNSRVADIFGTDVEVLPPPAVLRGLPYHVAESAALCFAQYSGEEKPVVHRLSPARIQAILSFVNDNTNLETGSVGVSFLSARFAPLDVFNNNPDNVLPEGHPLRVEADDWVAPREAVADDVDGAAGVLGRGLNWNDLMMPSSPRGVAADLAFHLGPRGTVASRASPSSFSAVTDELLKISFQEQLPGTTIDTPPAFLDGVSDREVGRVVVDFLRGPQLPSYLSIVHGSNTISALRELSALATWRSADAKRIKSLIGRLRLAVFPSLDRVFGFDGVGRLAGTRQVATDDVYTVMAQVMTLPPHANPLATATMNRFETVVSGLLQAIDDIPEGCDHPGYKIERILEFADNRKNDRELSTKAPSTTATKATGAAFGDIFSPKARRSLETLMSDERFRDLAITLREKAVLGQHFEYFDALFAATADGVVLPIQALACNLRGMPNDEVFTLMRDMQPHLARYFGRVLALDFGGRPRKSHFGYELPEAGLNLLLRGDLYGLLTFAYKKGIPHLDSRSLVGYPIPERKDWPTEMTGDILDKLADYIVPLLHAYGFRPSKRPPTLSGVDPAARAGILLRHGIDQAIRGTFVEVMQLCKVIIRTTPPPLRSSATPKCMELMKIACREATTNWQTVLRSSVVREFDPVLFDDHPDTDVYMEQYYTSLDMAHHASAWAFLKDSKHDAPPKGGKAKAPKDSGDDDDKEAKDPSSPGASPARKKAKVAPKDKKLPAGRIQFGHLDSGPGWMERYTFDRSSGEESIIRFDLNAVAKKVGVGVDERNWPYVLCKWDRERFYDKNRSKLEHSRIDNDLLSQLSRPPYVARRPL